MRKTKLIVLLLILVFAAVRASTDDAEDEARIRAGLYPKLATLSDGSAIRTTFDKALTGDPSAAPGLTALLKHSDINVAHEAAHVLGRFSSPEAAAALKDVFAHDGRALVRGGALTGLRRMGDPETASLAVSALSDSDGLVQFVGVGVLGLLKDSRNSPAILGRLDSIDQLEPESRKVLLDEILETLGELGDPPGSTAVRDRLAGEANKKTNEWDVRLAAARALEAMGMAALARRVLDRDDAGLTYDRMVVLRGKITRLASSKKLTIGGQGPLDSLLSELKASDPKDKDDYWGRPLRVRFVSMGVFNVVSDGPDKAVDTTDDLSTAEAFYVYDRRVFADLF
jgi:HEAT repeat protein